MNREDELLLRQIVESKIMLALENHTINTRMAPSVIVLPWTYSYLGIEEVRTIPVFYTTKYIGIDPIVY